MTSRMTDTRAPPIFIDKQYYRWYNNKYMSNRIRASQGENAMEDIFWTLQIFYEEYIEENILFFICMIAAVSALFLSGSDSFRESIFAGTLPPG